MIRGMIYPIAIRIFPTQILDDNQEFDENKNEDTNYYNFGLDDYNEMEENELQ